MALAGVIAAFLSSYANVARRRAWEVPSVVKYARYAAWLVFAVAAYDVARRIMARPADAGPLTPRSSSGAGGLRVEGAWRRARGRAGTSHAQRRVAHTGWPPC
ncbi:MAG: hypothetical protein WDN30_11600 [Pararobbsia sp.]